MARNFYPCDNNILKFDVSKEINEIRFNHYLMQKENLQRIKDELPKGRFYLTINSISDDLNLPIGIVRGLIKKFIKLNIITNVYKPPRGKRTPSIYTYNTIFSNNEENNESNNDKDSKINTLNSITNNESNNDINTSKKDNIKREYKKNIYSPFSSKDMENDSSNKTKEADKSRIEDIKEIVEYLNIKANKKYRYATKKTQSLIKARFAEGFETEDFKKVINVKTEKWINTDMEQYLRPETLFGSKFESYLNEKPKNQEENKKSVDEIKYNYLT